MSVSLRVEVERVVLVSGGAGADGGASAAAPKPHHEYEMRVSVGARSWTVRRRYREFDELRAALREHLQLSTTRKFARKARAYRRAYRVGSDNEHTSIEKMVKVFKAHRNAKDFAVSCILKS